MWLYSITQSKGRSPLLVGGANWKRGQESAEIRPVTLMVTLTVEFPGECGRILLHKVFVRLRDAVRV